MDLSENLMIKNSCLRRRRGRTAPDDLKILEAEFTKNFRPGKLERQLIAKRVTLSEREVQIWFQNRRQLARRQSINVPSDTILSHHTQTKSSPSDTISLRDNPSSTSLSSLASSTSSNSHSSTSESPLFSASPLRERHSKLVQSSPDESLAQLNDDHPTLTSTREFDSSSGLSHKLPRGCRYNGQACCDNSRSNSQAFPAQISSSAATITHTLQFTSPSCQVDANQQQSQFTQVSNSLMLKHVQSSSPPPLPVDLDYPGKCLPSKERGKADCINQVWRNQRKPGKLPRGFECLLSPCNSGEQNDTTTIDQNFTRNNLNEVRQLHLHSTSSSHHGKASTTIATHTDGIMPSSESGMSHRIGIQTHNQRSLRISYLMNDDINKENLQPWNWSDNSRLVAPGGRREKWRQGEELADRKDCIEDLVDDCSRSATPNSLASRSSNSSDNTTSGTSNCSELDCVRGLLQLSQGSWD